MYDIWPRRFLDNDHSSLTAATRTPTHAVRTQTIIGLRTDNFSNEPILNEKTSLLVLAVRCTLQRAIAANRMDGRTHELAQCIVVRILTYCQCIHLALCHGCNLKMKKNTTSDISIFDSLSVLNQSINPLIYMPISFYHATQLRSWSAAGICLLTLDSLAATAKNIGLILFGPVDFLLSTRSKVY